MEPESITTSYYHRNTIGSYGFESVLSEIHSRCKTNDNINQELERKLEMKNRQLSENHALLEQSRETITDLQNESDKERKENLKLQHKVNELEKDWKEYAVIKQEMREAEKNLKEKLRQAEAEITQKDHMLESLSANLKKTTSAKEAVIKDSRTSLDQLVEEKLQIAQQLEDQNENFNQLKKETDAIKEQLKAGEDNLHKVRSQLSKEEKLRKHIEKEVS